MRCPHCQHDLGSDDVNIAQDVAMCPACGELSRPSDAVQDADAGVDEAAAKLDEPPPGGCSFADNGIDLTWQASTRSLATGGFFAFFATFWNGITGVFVCLATVETLHHFGLTPPAWFPAPEWEDGDGFGGGLGGVLFFWLFLTPFILVGIGTAATAIVCVLGRVEVRVRQSEGSVRTGVGPLSWRKRFDAAGVKRVSVGLSSWETNGKKQQLIEIEAESGRKVRFGSLLREDRLAWLTASLRAALVPRTGGEGLTFAR